MPKTPGKIHMYDVVKIDTIVFEIVGGGGGLLNPANNAEQVWFNFVPTLTEQLFRLCDKNLFKLSYENVHLFVTTLCHLFVSTLFQVVTEIGTKLEQL